MSTTLIPFSGGLDSTYLLYIRLQQGLDIQLSYVELVNNVTKSEIEQRHRDALLGKMREATVTELGIVKVELPYSGLLNLVQPTVWLLGLVSQITTSHIPDFVELGYTSGDCALGYLDEIKTLWNSYQGFCNTPLPELRFPLIKEGKEDYFYKLPESIRELIWSCEAPSILENTEDYVIYKECGCECTPCKRSKYLGIFQERRFEYNKLNKSLTVIKDEKEWQKVKENNLTLSWNKYEVKS